MNIFTPDFGLLFWMVLAFAIVFAILAKWGFPVIVKAVNDRKAYIDESLRNAQLANERLANIKQESEQIRTEAQAEKQAILNEATQERQQIIAKAREEANTITRQQVEDAKAEIEETRRQQLKQMRADTAELAISVATKVMKRELSDEAAQRRAVEQELEDMK